MASFSYRNNRWQVRVRRKGHPTKTPRAGLSRGLTQRLPSVAIQKKSINQRLMDRHVPPRRCAPRDDGFCRPSLGQTL